MLIASPIINLQCNNISSCSTGQFELVSSIQNTTNVSIDCINDHISTSNLHSACGDAYFNAFSAYSVNIRCNNYDCYAAKFNVSNVISEITMECNLDYSCFESIIYGNMANKLSLICNGDSSCKYANTHCPTTDIESCNIHCTNTYDSTCQEMVIYVTNYDQNEYIDDFLNLQCDVDATNDGQNTCYQLELFCDESSILSSYIGISKQTGEYECQDVECCPLNSPSANITCSQGFDCDIKCNDNQNTNVVTTDTNNCMNKTIDGTDATSMRVVCSSDEYTGGASCTGATIYCPLLDKETTSKQTTSCMIECLESNACQNVKIYGGEKNNDKYKLYSLNITCSADKNSCVGLEINAYNIDVIEIRTGQQSENDFILYGPMKPLKDAMIYAQNIGNIKIGCNMYYGCYGLSVYVNQATRIDMNCMEANSCNDTNMNVSVSQVMQLQCKSANSCSGSYFIADEMDYVSINGLDKFALTNSTIYVSESDSVDIYCVSKTRYACHDLIIYIPSSLVDIDVYNNVLFCEIYGCGELNIYSINGMQDVNVEIDSNCVCDNVYDCIDSWNLFCGTKENEYKNSSIFNGKSCNGLCCDKIVSKTESSYKDYCDNFTLTNTTEIVEQTTTKSSPQSSNNGLSSQQILIYTLLVIGLLLCCCFTIYSFIVCRRKRKYNVLGNVSYFNNPFTNLTRRQKNQSVISQYTQMSDDDGPLLSSPNRLFKHPEETISETKEKEALTEMFNGKSIKRYRYDPNQAILAPLSHSISDDD